MSDDDELVKAGVQGLVQGAMGPFTSLLDKLLGGAAEQVGLALEGSARSYRWFRTTKRTVRYFNRTQELLSEAGIEPRSVPLKLLRPLFENGTSENEDDLQDKWAALLANSAAGEQEIMPAFPEILKQMTSQETHFLDRAYGEAINEEERLVASRHPEHRAEPPEWVRISGQLLESFNPVMLDNLERLGVITRNSVPLIKHQLPTRFRQATMYM